MIKLSKDKRNTIYTLVLPLVLSLIIFYLSNNVIHLFNTRDYKALNNLGKILLSFKIYFEQSTLLTSIAISVAFYIWYYSGTKKRKNLRDKEEYGSARFGTRKDILPFYDSKEPFKNIILSDTEFLRFLGEPQSFEFERGKHVLIVGGTGSGKTYSYISPNILQGHSSFVITDPKGDLIKKLGNFLLREKYEIPVLNIKDSESIRKYSLKYNPFVFIENELDILTLINTLIENTSGEHDKRDFWVKSEILLYGALISYIINCTPKQNHNFYSLLTMIRACEVRESQENFKNPIDILFDELENQDVWTVDKNGDKHVTKGKDLFCFGRYKEFKLSAGKTAKSILISCAVRLSVFAIKEVRELTSTNEIDMQSIGDHKTALFVITSDTDYSLNFLVSIFYTQLFHQLVKVADNKYDGELPMPVRCMLDEFAQLGKISHFERLISTIRSRGISVNVVVQAISQIKTLYKDKKAETILSNFDSLLFLGGKEQETLKEISVLMGKETVDIINTGQSVGKDKSRSTNYQRIARDLMTTDELAKMKGTQCIVHVRGIPAFKSLKYNIRNHPNYKYTSYCSKSNHFDVEKYIKFHRRKAKQKTDI